jgi:hypothetical protein
MSEMNPESQTPKMHQSATWSRFTSRCDDSNYRAVAQYLIEDT